MSVWMDCEMCGLWNVRCRRMDVNGCNDDRRLYVNG